MRTIHLGSTLARAHLIMKHAKRDFLIVTNEQGRSVGIVRDIDIQRAIAERKKMIGVPLIVDHFMLSPVVVIEGSGDANIEEYRPEFEHRTELKAIVLTKDGKPRKVLFREDRKIKKRAS